jgi:hypothetical protein
VFGCLLAVWLSAGCLVACLLFGCLLIVWLADAGCLLAV